MASGLGGGRVSGSRGCRVSGVSDSVECRSVGLVLTPLDTIDTVHTWAVSRWLDTGLTLVAECRAELSVDTGVGVSGVSGRCRDLVSKCRARAQR